MSDAVTFKFMLLVWINSLTIPTANVMNESVEIHLIFKRSICNSCKQLDRIIVLWVVAYYSAAELSTCNYVRYGEYCGSSIRQVTAVFEECETNIFTYFSLKYLILGMNINYMNVMVSFLKSIFMIFNFGQFRLPKLVFNYYKSLFSDHVHCHILNPYEEM